MKNHLYDFLYLPVTQAVDRFTPGKKTLLCLLQSIVIIGLVGFHLAMTQNFI